MKIGRLGYNVENDRYGILSGDLWVDTGLHCGEVFEVLINDEWVLDRIELNWEGWYLVYSKIVGKDLEGLKVRI